MYKEIKKPTIRKLKKAHNNHLKNPNWDLGRYIFGADYDIIVPWKYAYNHNFDLFKEDVLHIYAQRKKRDEELNLKAKQTIHTSIIDGKYYHLDETTTSFYCMIFYEIYMVNDVKYFMMNFITTPGSKYDDKKHCINYCEYSEDFRSLTRKEYIQKSKTEGNINHSYQMVLSEMLKHDLYHNLVDVFLNKPISGKCSAEEAFYFNDLLVRGRTELSFDDLSEDTECGKYFCFGLDDDYQYQVEHDFKLSE